MEHYLKDFISRKDTALLGQKIVLNIEFISRVKVVVFKVLLKLACEHL